MEHRLASLCTTLLLVAAAHAAEPTVADLLKRVPAPSAAEGAKVSKALMARGAPAIEAIVKMLTPAGKGDDTKPRMALHGLAIYVSRPGAEVERKAFALALAKQLAVKLDPQVNGYLIRQLQIAGGQEAVDAIAPALLADAQCDDAAQALLAIREGSAGALAKALPQAKGKCRRAILQALGALGGGAPSAALIAAASDKDVETRVAAVFALARAGDPAGIDAVTKAAAAEGRYERSQATEACLILADRLAAAGRAADADRLYRTLLPKSVERQYRCAAVNGLATASGARAVDALLAALSDEDPQVRAAARRAAIAVPGQAATQLWVKELAPAEPAAKVEMLAVLAGRDDAAALPTALAAMKDKDESVRVAAITAAGVLGKTTAVKPLVAVLASKSRAERDAAVRALKAMPGTEPTDAICAAQLPAAADVRVALLGVLASRGAVAHLPGIFTAAVDKNESVTAAAYSALGRLVAEDELGQLLDLLVKEERKKARSAAERAAADVCGRVHNKTKAAELVVARIPKASDTAKCALLRVTRRTGSSRAVPALRDALKHKNADVQNAAVRTMADWPSAAVAGDLIELARSSENKIHRILALRGYVKVIGLKSKRPATDTLEMHVDAMKLARRPDERKLVLGGVGKIKHPAALKMAMSYTTDTALRNEAAAAAVNVADAIQHSHTTDAQTALLKLVKAELGGQKAKDVLAEIAEREAYITAWMVAGPYSVKGKRGSDIFDKPFPPEDAKAKDVKWEVMPPSKDKKRKWMLDLDLVMKGSNRVGYLRTHVSSPVAQSAQLELGSDDGIKVWLNGKVIHSKNVPRSLKANEDKLKVQLVKGWNTIMLKVMNLGGQFNASARLIAIKGEVLEPVRVCVDMVDG